MLETQAVTVIAVSEAWLTWGTGISIIVGAVAVGLAIASFIYMHKVSQAASDAQADIRIRVADLQASFKQLYEEVWGTFREDHTQFRDLALAGRKQQLASVTQGVAQKEQQGASARIEQVVPGKEPVSREEVTRLVNEAIIATSERTTEAVVQKFQVWEPVDRAKQYVLFFLRTVPAKQAFVSQELLLGWCDAAGHSAKASQQAIGELIVAGQVEVDPEDRDRIRLRRP